MNKATKIRLNYIIGLIVTVILLWAIYSQVQNQLLQVDIGTAFQEGAHRYLLLSFLLLPVNLGLEIYKWKLLVASAQPISNATAIRSFFAGLALSILTPNRIGEYPGRIIYLKQKNTPRLISITFLGMFTQFLCLMIFGIAGLVYYNIMAPSYWAKLVLVATIVASIVGFLIFWNFEKWSRSIERFEWLSKFKTYTQLLKRFSIKEQLSILAISMLRFITYTLQYLLLLYWMHIEIDLLTGFCMACMFFFSMAIVPSIALAEMGIRGQLSLLFFQQLTSNKIGILIATIVLWFINLIIPAIVGSTLWIKLRLIK